jgi:hypothetical protein
MCAFEKHSSNKVKSEVEKRYLRFARGDGESFGGLKVCKRSFLGVLRV